MKPVPSEEQSLVSFWRVERWDLSNNIANCYNCVIAKIYARSTLPAQKLTQLTSFTPSAINRGSTITKQPVLTVNRGQLDY